MTLLSHLKIAVDSRIDQWIFPSVLWGISAGDDLQALYSVDEYFSLNLDIAIGSITFRSFSPIDRVLTWVNQERGLFHTTVDGGKKADLLHNEFHVSTFSFSLFSFY